MIQERTRRIEWLTCDGCGLLWPADANVSPGVERVTTCQRCLYAENAKFCRLTALSSPSPQRLEETSVRRDIARLLSGRCNNCYNELPIGGAYWVTANFGPFCETCRRLAERSSPSEPHK